jgi:peptide/nickel transport system permease protein
MLRHIIRRLLLAIPTLLAVFTVIFIIVRVAPGDPATAVLGDNASPQAVESLRERMGLNEPLWKQYLTFLADLARGDLGDSLKTSQPVWIQIRSALPHTLELTCAAILIGLAIGVPVGVVTAIKQNKAPDYIGRIVSLVGLSLPAFYLAILFIYFFAVKLDWFPAVGAPAFSDPVANLRSLVLPALTLGLIEMAYIARMTRSVMISILNDDYVRTARAKGLAQRKVILKHVLKNALIPVVTLIGPIFAAVGTGSFFVEQVFNIPGMGKYYVSSMQSKDQPMILAVTLIFGVFLAFMNLLVDIAYGLIDPRIRY